MIPVPRDYTKVSMNDMNNATTTLQGQDIMTPNTFLTPSEDTENQNPLGATAAVTRVDTATPGSDQLSAVNPSRPPTNRFDSSREEPYVIATNVVAIPYNPETNQQQQHVIGHSENVGVAGVSSNNIGEEGNQPIAPSSPLIYLRDVRVKIGIGLVFTLIIGLICGLSVSISSSHGGGDKDPNEINTIPTIEQASHSPSFAPSASLSYPLLLSPTSSPSFPTSSPSFPPSPSPTHLPSPHPTEVPAFPTCSCKEIRIIQIQTDREGLGEGEEVEVKLSINDEVVWPSSDVGHLPHDTFAKNQWLSISGAISVYKRTGPLKLQAKDYDDFGDDDIDWVVVPMADWNEKDCNMYEKVFEASKWRFKVRFTSSSGCMG